MRFHKNAVPAGIFFLLVMFLFLTGCTAARLTTNAETLASAGEWDEAVLIYRDLNRKDPLNLDYKLKYFRASFEAAQIHYKRGEGYLEKGNHEMAVLEFQAALLLEPSFDKAKVAINKIRRLMDSIYYYGKGFEAVTKGNEKEAKTAFKKSIALNPENQATALELEKLRSSQKVVMDGLELDLKSTTPITLEFRDAGVKKVFEVISKLSGMNFIFDPEVRDERITLFVKDATFQQALELVLMTGKLGRKIVSENTIILYPSTPQKIAQYEELMIKVFYLTNTNAKKAMNLFKTMVKIRDMAVDEELNAIMVRARPDVIELAEKVLETIDIADSEVMFDVSIIEINRTKASNLGIDLSPDAISANIPTRNGTIALRDLRDLPAGDLLIGVPGLTLNFKREDLDANILANPRIRVKNNNKAKIHIGDRVPIITTTVNQGVSTENIQYQDVGLKLIVEPTIRQNDDVDLKLGLEVSSLGTKTVTSSGSVVYQIGTRNTETVLRLRDGETQVIGGLINDEERTTTAKIPFIGEIPIIGRLFSRVDNSAVKTEVLLSITPHILKNLEIPESAKGFMSGRDDNPSGRPALEGFSEYTPSQNQISRQPSISGSIPEPLAPPPPPVISTNPSR